jgi:hypothetical protein
MGKRGISDFTVNSNLYGYDNLKRRSTFEKGIIFY